MNHDGAEQMLAVIQHDRYRKVIICKSFQSRKERSKHSSEKKESEKGRSTFSEGKKRLAIVKNPPVVLFCL